MKKIIKKDNKSNHKKYSNVDNSSVKALFWGFLSYLVLVFLLSILLSLVIMFLDLIELTIPKRDLLKALDFLLMEFFTILIFSNIMTLLFPIRILTPNINKAPHFKQGNTQKNHK